MNYQNLLNNFIVANQNELKGVDVVWLSRFANALNSIPHDTATTNCNDEILALKAALKYTEFSSAGECCPYCGGHLHHAIECGIDALLREEAAERFADVIGTTVIKNWIWSVNHEEKYASLKAAV